MRSGNLKIHSENILPIIKKWLYTDKEIFVRELISNACDAIHKLKVLEIGDEFRIDLKIDAEGKKLIFSDNGIGMDAEEVETYIAQIAFSGAEEFAKKYETSKEGDQIIGHFGLGFYSAYMVASMVEIDTLSHKEGAEAVLWSCDGSTSYNLDNGKRTSRGTDIILHVTPEEEEFLDPVTLRKILDHYCSFLPYPIYLNGSRINEEPPLWLKSASDCSDQDYLSFYRKLFPMEPDPHFWIHLNIDYPFNLRGILYFPKINKETDFKRDRIKLFCNRVFVSDNCKDLLPDYLMILRGAIDSPDIPLNVSRSTLQMDKTVRQLATHISKKISDRLATLYRTERDKFLTCWEDVELIVKYGALQDDKFYERVKEFLVWQDLKEEWRTLGELTAGKEEKRLYYTSDKHLPFLDLYKKQGIDVLYIPDTFINQALIDFLEGKEDVKFTRVDSELGGALLDGAKEKTVLDAEGKTEGARLAAFFRSKLGLENVEAKSLAAEAPPALLTIKESERRLRAMLSAQSSAPMKDLVKPTLVINTNSALITSIVAVEQKDPALAREMAATVYDLARLSHREMDPEALPAFIARSTSVLEKLVQLNLD